MLVAFYFGGPMRLTVLDDDPGRKINPMVERYLVFLDGNEVKTCFTADDDKGLVIFAVRDESGHIVIEDGEPKRCTCHGKVKIEQIY
jgi:hypothetical protein